MIKRLHLTAALLIATVLAGCERPPVDTVQRGYRGTAMVQVYNPRTMAEQADKNKAPPSLDAASPDGPKARDIYQNVKILGDESVGQFARTMASMTAWVSPEKGCAYCHNVQNFADDSLYTKVVARRMLQMTQKVNADWKSHVAATGVTCYTCHRGQPVPNEVWFKPLNTAKMSNFAGDRAGQNAPGPEVGMASLPTDIFTPFLLGQENIRVGGVEALPAGNRQSIKQAEWTYGLMVHMSKSLGVNCTQCHNTRAFADWSNSSPPRVTAWYGIRMVRELNNDFLVPLTDTFPAYRHGPGGDVAKVNCATCHQGAHKPLYGAQMAKDYPELLTKQMESALPAAATASAALVSEADLKAVGALATAPESKVMPVVLQR